jgi:RNA polymerase sigma-70 factor (ECF subfamily)
MLDPAERRDELPDCNRGTVHILRESATDLGPETRIDYEYDVGARQYGSGSRRLDSDLERFVIDCAQNGSRHAWRQLFEWHFDAVYQFCRRVAAGRQDWAEDISQQTFVTAARRIARFEPSQGTFRTWLFGIARNCHLTLAAKEARRRRHEVSAAEANPGRRNAGDRDLRVRETLARLPHRYRTILEAKYLRQLTLAEIARADGQSVEAVESLLRRARDRFAEVYERQGE